MFAHLYKDITKQKKWPLWTEIVGILIAIVLIYEGYRICNYFIIIVGILKFLAHIRQYILQDNRYYY